MCVCVCVRARVCALLRVRALAHVHERVQAGSHTRPRMRARAHVCARARSHTGVCAHIVRCVCARALVRSSSSSVWVARGRSGGTVVPLSAGYAALASRVIRDVGQAVSSELLHTHELWIF